MCHFAENRIHIPSLLCLAVTFTLAPAFTSAETIGTVSNKQWVTTTPGYHQVKVGETLYAIGLSSGFGYPKLAVWNHIAPPYLIRVGQSLKLFPPAPATKITPSNTHHNIIVTKSTDNTPLPILATTTAKHIQALPFSFKKKPTSQEKKSAISIDNKRVLKLNFKWPIKGKVLKNFSQSSQQGIEIANEITKQPVFAAETGQVVYMGKQLNEAKNFSFQNLIIIKHNQDYLSAYANTSRMFVKEGQRIEKGQAIAEIDVKKHSKNALHFEIRKNGNPVNPINLLPK